MANYQLRCNMKKFNQGDIVKLITVADGVYLVADLNDNLKREWIDKSNMTLMV